MLLKVKKNLLASHGEVLEPQGDDSRNNARVGVRFQGVPFCLQPLDLPIERLAPLPLLGRQVRGGGRRGCMQGGRLGPRRVELLLRDVYGRVCPAAMDRLDEVDYRELHPHDLALVEPTLEAVLGERIGDVLLADRERAEADGPLEELAREGEHVVATVVAVRLPRDAMLKAEAAKGHCFLGFEKEVHHEFNY